MDAETSWRVIAEQRRCLADLLQGLTAEQWRTPSLCTGWSVRDVAAHVALAPQPPGLGSMLVEGVRARGSFDRLNHDLAVRHATRPTDRIVAELREHADSRRLPAVTSYRNIVPDILVHGQDIAIPLGLPHPVPVPRRGRRRDPRVAHGLAVLGPPAAGRRAPGRHGRRLDRRAGPRGARPDRRDPAAAHRPHRHGPPPPDRPLNCR
jgi:uncharacterized protein (TIGR03083 family)